MSLCQRDALESLVKEYNWKARAAHLALAAPADQASWVRARRQVSRGASLPEQSIRGGQGRVFSTPEPGPGCPLRR